MEREMSWEEIYREVDRLLGSRRSSGPTITTLPHGAKQIKMNWREF